MFKRHNNPGIQVSPVSFRDVQTGQRHSAQVIEGSIVKERKPVVIAEKARRMAGAVRGLGAAAVSKVNGLASELKRTRSPRDARQERPSAKAPAQEAASTAPHAASAREDSTRDTFERVMSRMGRTTKTSPMPQYEAPTAQRETYIGRATVAENPNTTHSSQHPPYVGRATVGQHQPDGYTARHAGSEEYHIPQYTSDRDR